MRAVAGGVGLDDPHRGARRRGRRRRHRPAAAHPGRQHLPLGIALRLPVLAAAVEGVAAGVAVERMQEQTAGGRRPGHDQRRRRLEVLARRLLAPGGGAVGQRLQLQPRADLAVVARDTRHQALALGQEQRLHLGGEGGEVEGGRRLGRRQPWLRRRRRRTAGRSNAPTGTTSWQALRAALNGPECSRLRGRPRGDGRSPCLRPRSPPTEDTRAHARAHSAAARRRRPGHRRLRLHLVAERRRRPSAPAPDACCSSASGP